MSSASGAPAHKWDVPIQHMKITDDAAEVCVSALSLPAVLDASTAERFVEELRSMRVEDVGRYVRDLIFPPFQLTYSLPFLF